MSLQARKPLTLELPATKAAVGVARAALGDGDGGPIAERLVLLTSELVTNAVRHGGQDIVLRATFEAPAIRVEVHDGGAGFDAAAALARPATAAGGFGLKIVDRLADRWGAERRVGLVWFELDFG